VSQTTSLIGLLVFQPKGPCVWWANFLRWKQVYRVFGSALCQRNTRSNWRKFAQQVCAGERGEGTTADDARASLVLDGEWRGLW